LQASEVKQIAGRAGRYSSDHPRGYVTCLHGEGMEHLHACMASRSEEISSACLLPRWAACL
jgi:ATP-dependent RNA helicase SUPV3L1/SUV3